MSKYLQKHLGIMDFLKLQAKQHEKKKAWTFDAEQTEQFMLTAPNKNRYWLVRKGVVAISLYGGLRGEEMRLITRSNIKSVTKGYEVTYVVSKNRVEVKRNM